MIAQRIARPPLLRFNSPVPQGPYIREKFTKDRNAARKHAAEYFQRFPKDRYRTRAARKQQSTIFAKWAFSRD